MAQLKVELGQAPGCCFRGRPSEAASTGGCPDDLKKSYRHRGCMRQTRTVMGIIWVSLVLQGSL